eukprot:TRINITY_DN12587_c0_g2_i1.p1 TRINITY_DN12587_c0_g2~~TRINITY_DN12587_c0_g2_i1.p1  ORF type:complete len:964 (-),score=101.65 TRINITY_DN12587_c0_g2_i1:25-2916(-)
MNCVEVPLSPLARRPLLDPSSEVARVRDEHLPRREFRGDSSSSKVGNSSSASSSSHDAVPRATEIFRDSHNSISSHVGTSHQGEESPGRSFAMSSLFNRPQLSAAFRQLTQRPQVIARELSKPQSKPITSMEVYAAERSENIRRFERLALACSEPPVPFSLALSGGGIRAAAFHCGVLWRLASKGILKDIEHLSLVSGGAYVGTSYISFLLAGMTEAGTGQANGGPSCTDEDINRWHLNVVWKMIDRMQTNSGFFIRFVSDPVLSVGSRPWLGSVVSLVSILFFSHVFSPVSNFLLVAVPLSTAVNKFAGKALRDAYCSNNTELMTQVRVSVQIVFAMFALIAFCQVMLSYLGRHHKSHNQARRSEWVGRWMRLLFSVRSLMSCWATLICVIVFLGAACLGIQHLWQEKTGGCPKFHAVPRQRSWRVMSLWAIANVWVIMLGILGSTLRWSFLFIRIHHVGGILAVMWATFMTVYLCAWRSFTEPDVLVHDKRWRAIMVSVFCLALLLLPAYGEFRRLVHVYYRRCLRKAFYHNGEDMPLIAAQGVSLCPNIIVAATLVDYCRLDNVDDTTHYSEFFFTQRCMGGDRTGFIDMPGGLSLATVMAISGAATDAFLLTKLNAVWVRITLLGLFNLFMGDYVEFASSWQQGLWCSRLQALCVNIVFVSFFVFLFFSYQDEFKHDYLLWIPSLAVMLLVCASFFASFKCFRWLLCSTIIRHIHMALMHYHTSDEPPLRLFLNDGGLVECLGLISLLRRRCRYMLVSDATADFKMTLICLRETMKIARDERICTFFDVDDPRRGVEPLLERFSAGHGTYLRLGVLYDCFMERDSRVMTSVSDSTSSHPGFSAGQEKTGEIIFVRMRLIKTGVLTSIPCRVTEDEVLGGVPYQHPMMTAEGVVEQESIGGCCCDCCHKHCNCGLLGRFPEIGTGNLFLTPTQFALLCRLGYEASADAVESLSAVATVSE